MIEKRLVSTGIAQNSILQFKKITFFVSSSKCMSNEESTMPVVMRDELFPAVVLTCPIKICAPIDSPSLYSSELSIWY